MKTILVNGFPHCGTSILKSIIGNCNNVYCHPGESFSVSDEHKRIYLEKGYDFIVIKWPYYINSNVFKKVLIIRNPYYVFSSLSLRHHGKLPTDNDHLFSTYENYASNFLKIRESPPIDIITVKYEDLFVNNFYFFRKILDEIGCAYDDLLFDNEGKKNTALIGFDIPEYKPDRGDHGNFRTWQINQKFHNMNYRENLKFLDDNLKKQLDNSELIRRLGY